MTQILTGSGIHEIFDCGSYSEEIITGKDKEGTGGFCKISWRRKASITINEKKEEPKASQNE